MGVWNILVRRSVCSFSFQQTWKTQCFIRFVVFRRSFGVLVLLVWRNKKQGIPNGCLSVLGFVHELVPSLFSTNMKNIIFIRFIVFRRSSSGLVLQVWRSNKKRKSNGCFNNLGFVLSMNLFLLSFQQAWIVIRRLCSGLVLLVWRSKKKRKPNGCLSFLGFVRELVPSLFQTNIKNTMLYRVRSLSAFILRAGASSLTKKKKRNPNGCLSVVGFVRDFVSSFFFQQKWTIQCF